MLTFLRVENRVRKQKLSFSRLLLKNLMGTVPWIHLSCLQLCLSLQMYLQDSSTVSEVITLKLVLNILKILKMWGKKTFTKSFIKAFGLHAVPGECAPRLALDSTVVKYSLQRSLNFTHCCVILK